MKLDEKVLLGRLYERTSQKGNRYFSGRLGAARIMLFRDDYADDDNVWQLFVQDGGEKSPQVAQEREGPTKMTPTARKRPKATSGPGKAAKWHKAQEPFFDDPLPDNLA